MFYVRTAWKNVRRYRYKSILTLLICAAAVILLDVYIGSLEKSREQLFDLRDKIPVEGIIMNLSGGREAGLFIKESYYEAVMNSSMVKEPKFTLQLLGQTGEEEVAVMAANTWRAVPGLRAEDLPVPDTFFASSENECLVTEAFLKDTQLKEGDAFSLPLQYYELNKENHLETYAKPLGETEFRIAGVIRPEGEEKEYFPEILLPMETARGIYHSKEIPFYVDSGSFLVKDPRELNALKEEMDEAGFMELVPAAQPALEGYALILHDEKFIRATGSLEDGYQTMRLFFPAVCLVLAGAGFIAVYLLTGSRRQEYAVMRSMGVGRRGCLAIYLLEYGTVEALGGFAGSAAAMVFVTGLTVGKMISCFLLFYLCFFAGTVVSFLMLGRISVMRALAKAD